MLKLPTNAGEWGFVIVLSVLFGGLTFAVIYSQIQLHDMGKAQAVQDTEINLRMISERVREHHSDTGRVEDSLLEMGVSDDALETRNAVIEPGVVRKGEQLIITATLIKYSQARCTLTFDLKGEVQHIVWTDD